MASIRENIINAIGKLSVATIDDLSLGTLYERKKLSDNLKSLVQDEFIERIKDDVTGLPAYRLLEKGKQRACAVTPQPEVGKNTGNTSPLSLSEPPSLAGDGVAEGGGDVVAIQASPTTAPAVNWRYGYMHIEESFNTPEDAIDELVGNVGTNGLGNFQIIRFQPVGFVLLKPVLVPTEAVSA